MQIPTQVDIAEHLELPGMTPSRLVDRLERSAGNVARVVDEDVDICALAGEFAQRAAIAQVNRMHGRTALQLRLCVLEARRVARRKMHIATFGGKGVRAGKTDAFRSARNEDRLAFETEIH